MEFELAYYDSVVHRFNHSTTRTPACTQTKNRVNISSVWSPQRNCYRHNNPAERYESSGSLTQRWHWFLWSILRRDIGTILASFLFVIFLDYILRTSIKRTKNGHTLKETKSRWCCTETTTDADDAEDQVLLTNTPAQVKSSLHSPEQTTRGIGLYINLDKPELMYFKQNGAISSLLASLGNCSHTSIAISYLQKMMPVYA